MKGLILIGALALAACGKTTAPPPQPLAYARPPADKLVCDAEPGRPEGSGAEYTDARGIQRREITDDDNGKYLQALSRSGQSCRDDVNWMRLWFDKLGKAPR